MSFNKYMHSRNKYRTPPNFKDLAIQYPEFRKHVSQDLSGKIKFNFKNEDALRTLTKILLQHDFNININIPSNHLVPTLPLRLNYILWIEDLLTLNNIHGTIHGIDIGTGASCIYPLLGCKEKSWNMLALDNEKSNYEYALKNVCDNKMEHLINVQYTENACTLESSIDQNTIYHFTMCNPPFFSSDEDVTSETKSRNDNRKKPRNIKTGIKNELVVEGGEIEFVKNIIKNNLDLKNIKIFTTMLGHKSSIKPITTYLQQQYKIETISYTEFCQGNTMRWGMAWTNDPNIKLINFIKEKVKDEKCKPVSYIIENKELKLNNVIERIQQLCDKLKIIYKILEKTEKSSKISITAYENTWTNQRRLKRQLKLNENNFNNIKKVKVDLNSDITTNGDQKPIEETTNRNEANTTNGEINTDQKSNSIVKAPNQNTITTNQNTIANTITNDINKPLVICDILIQTIENNDIVIEIIWVAGTGTKELPHQIIQYMKNNIK